MAHLTNDQMKNFRAEIKARFPARDGWKFSVTKRHHNELSIALIQYPVGYSFPGHQQLNHYHINSTKNVGEKEIEVIREMARIANIGHWDESDTMIDYFHCSHYISLSIGKWDKPAIAKA